MKLALKTIGVAAGAALLFVGSAAVTGHVLDQQTGADAPGAVMHDAPPAAEPNLEKQATPKATSEPESNPAPPKEPGQIGVSTPAKKPALVIKRILPIDGPIKYGEWHWDDAGVPDGPLLITVDLEARVISVFRDGYEIGAAAVLLGTDDHPTPLGTFPILQKRKDHVSNLYDAEMPYMMRLTWDGITIHGSEVENGYASHGCIGTPGPFAKKLFSVAKLGDRVIITKGKMVGVGDALVEG